jgi:hypothetical protein
VSVSSAEVDGYAFHRANDTYVRDVRGFGSPEVRTVREPAPRRHGAWDVTSLYGPRVMQWTGWCGQVPSGATDPAVAVAAFDALKAAFYVEDDHLLVFRREGMAADEQAEVRLAGPIEGTWTAGGSVIEWSMDLVAPDPLLYGTVLNTQAGTTNGGVTLTTVGGTVPTPGILQVRGPTSGTGTLTVSDGLGGVVALEDAAALAAYDPGDPDSFLDVYLADRDVQFLGNSMGSWIDPEATTWWRIRPGSSVVLTLGGTARQSGTRLAAYWREARL